MQAVCLYLTDIYFEKLDLPRQGIFSLNVQKASLPFKILISVTSSTSVFMLKFK